MSRWNAHVCDPAHKVDAASLALAKLSWFRRAPSVGPVVLIEGRRGPSDAGSTFRRRLGALGYGAEGPDGGGWFGPGLGGERG
jgi:hypothetical protein